MIDFIIKINLEFAGLSTLFKVVGCSVDTDIMKFKGRIITIKQLLTNFFFPHPERVTKSLIK